MAFEAYLYIEKIRGDSTSKIAKEATGVPANSGPIEIKSYGLGIEMPVVENRSGTGAVTVGRANFEDFETAKDLDVSTQALLFSCLAGTHINQAVVMVYRSVGEGDGTKPTLYMKLVYEHIIITEVSVSGSGEEVPTETLKFNYGTVKYEYTKTNRKTGVPEGGVVSFEWDRSSNTGKK